MFTQEWWREAVNDALNLKWEDEPDADPGPKSPDCE